MVYNILYDLFLHREPKMNRQKPIKFDNNAITNKLADVFSDAGSWRSLLCRHVFAEESGNAVEGNFFGVVVEVAMACSGHNEQFLVVTLQF